MSEFCLGGCVGCFSAEKVAGRIQMEWSEATGAMMDGKREYAENAAATLTGIEDDFEDGLDTCDRQTRAPDLHENGVSASGECENSEQMEALYARLENLGAAPVNEFARGQSGIRDLSQGQFPQ